jgi:hypothetical protein
MKKRQNSQKSIEEALIDLYLNVKIRKQDEVQIKIIKDNLKSYLN